MVSQTLESPRTRNGRILWMLSSTKTPHLPSFFVNPLTAGQLVVGVALLMTGSVVLTLFRAYCCHNNRATSEETGDETPLLSPSHSSYHHYGSVRPSHSCCDRKL